MLIETFSEWFVSFGFDKFKDKLKKQNDERQIKKRLNEFLFLYKKDFERIDLENEFDLQGVLDCFNNINNEINNYLFGTSYDERVTAKEAIIAKVHHFSNAKNSESKKQVDLFIQSILNIYRAFYVESIDNDLLFATVILSNEMIPKLNDISEKIDRISNPRIGELAKNDSHISTDQIFTKDEFVMKYDKAPTAAPLNTSFMFRQKETNDIKTALSEYNTVLLSGDAGIGKTRLALEAAEQYARENEYQFRIIRNNNEKLWDDLNYFFKKNGQYIILIDDANQISNLQTYLEFLRDRSNSIKLIITVRKYALEDVSAKTDAVMKNKLIQIDKLTDTEIEKMIAGSYHLNSQALEKIASLSNGNPRIAFIAKKLAYETNSISSLNNISELYKNYYGTFLKEQDIDEKLFKCAGIAAFIKRINLDYLSNMKELLEGCDIYYLSINNDFEAFKKLYLFPTSCSWIGSELPLIQSKIDFLTELKRQLTEVSYLQHKAYINELIEETEKYKEMTEVEEMLERK